MTSPVIRRASESDRPAIESLLGLAFAPSTYETRLVASLFAGDPEEAEAFHDWVVERDGAVHAYILYTAAFRGAAKVGFHLAPIAVHPDAQGGGLGSALITTSLDSAALRESAVFVLGDPGYYERFGFAEVRSARCPFDPDNAHFRALRWNEVREHFTIGYVAAFEQAAAE